MEKKEVTKKESSLDDSVDLSPMTEQLDKTSEINIDYNSFKLPILARDGEPVYKPLTFKEQIYIKDDSSLYINNNGTWFKVGGTTTIGKMYKNAAQSVASGNSSFILLDTNEIDVNITIDTTQNRITIEEAGYYYICGQVGWSATVDANVYIAEIALNGTVITSTFLQASATGAYYLMPTVSLIKYLSVGDYIQLKGGQSTGGNVNTLGGDSKYTYLYTYKI
jgi:hypothetical protein